MSSLYDLLEKSHCNLYEVRMLKEPTRTGNSKHCCSSVKIINLKKRENCVKQNKDKQKKKKQKMEVNVC